MVRPQYALSYNQANGGPNWVSWHLERADLGRTRRTNAWGPDPLLPKRWWVRPSEYSGSGFTRGHQCPSGDRTGSRRDNAAVFVMSNMLPQTRALNGQVWEQLESYCRTLARQGNELYIVSGGIGSRGTIARGRVRVPSRCWKVVVVLPAGGDDLRRIDRETRVIAVDLPNRSGIAKDAWRAYLTTVDAIEAATGYDLLSNLPVEIQKVLEAKKDTTGAPPGRTFARRIGRGSR